MNVLQRFVSELKRRQVLRACTLYAGVAWLLISVADIALPLLSAPSWAMPALLYSAVLGFPVAATLSWFLRMGPRGYEPEASATPTVAQSTDRRFFDVTIISVLAAALAVSLYVNLAGPRGLSDGRYSVAVLPFRDLSPTGSHNYLAEGIAEELLTSLMLVDELTVISRNSSFRFARGDTPISEIAQQLNVDNVVSGSVRTAGNVVRISVQLVDAATDSNRWSFTYERSLDDIFLLQDRSRKMLRKSLS